MKKDITRAILFCIGTALLFMAVSSVFRLDSQITETSVKGFYAEDTALDAVYIGASGVYRYWQAPIAWDAYGMAVLDFSTSAQPDAAKKYIIEDCLREQDPDLIILCARGFAGEDPDKKIFSMHHLFDYYRPSVTKLKMIDAVCDSMGVYGPERLEYYFPIVRFHARWTSLQKSNFRRDVSTVKNALCDDEFFTSVVDYRGPFIQTDNREELMPVNESLLIDLLDYCDTLQTPVLFVISPTLEDDGRKEQFNTIGDIIRQRGYDFINFDRADLVEDMGLLIPDDFQDRNHTNLNGSIKYTLYFGKILSEYYDLPDHRDDPAYTSWDAAYREYTEIIAPYLNE